MWHVTHDRCQKSQKSHKKYQKVLKSVKKAEFHRIGATSRTRQESRCFPYAVFFLYKTRCRPSGRAKTHFVFTLKFRQAIYFKKLHLPVPNGTMKWSQAPWKCFLIEGFKKTIESVIMIIPCQTPSPLFFRTVIALGFFFLGYKGYKGYKVCLENSFGNVSNKLWLCFGWNLPKKCSRQI